VLGVAAPRADAVNLQTVLAAGRLRRLTVMDPHRNHRTDASAGHGQPLTRAVRGTGQMNLPRAWRVCRKAVPTTKET